MVRWESKQDSRQPGTTHLARVGRGIEGRGVGSQNDAAATAVATLQAEPEGGSRGEFRRGAARRVSDSEPDCRHPEATGRERSPKGPRADLKQEKLYPLKNLVQ
jgi:hypothetical protein